MKRKKVVQLLALAMALAVTTTTVVGNVPFAPTEIVMAAEEVAAESIVKGVAVASVRKADEEYDSTVANQKTNLSKIEKAEINATEEKATITVYANLSEMVSYTAQGAGKRKHYVVALQFADAAAIKKGSGVQADGTNYAIEDKDRTDAEKYVESNAGKSILFWLPADQSQCTFTLTYDGKTQKVEVNVVDISARSITLDKTTAKINTAANYNEANTTVTLTPSLNYNDGDDAVTSTKNTVTWTSSDPSKATVTKSTADAAAATVTAVAAGKVTITATTGSGKTASCEITIKDTYGTAEADNADKAALTFDDSADTVTVKGKASRGYEYVILEGEQTVSDSDLVWTSVTMGSEADQDGNYTGTFAVGDKYIAAEKIYVRAKGDATHEAGTAVTKSEAFKTSLGAYADVVVSSDSDLGLVYNATLTVKLVEKGAGTDAEPVTLTGATLAYKWYRVNGAQVTEIGGATARTYKLQAQDRGYAIKAVVTDSASNYSGELTWSSTGDVQPKTITRASFGGVAEAEDYGSVTASEKVALAAEPEDAHLVLATHCDVTYVNGSDTYTKDTIATAPAGTYKVYVNAKSTAKQYIINNIYVGDFVINKVAAAKEDFAFTRKTLGGYPADLATDNSAKLAYNGNAYVIAAVWKDAANETAAPQVIITSDEAGNDTVAEVVDTGTYYVWVNVDAATNHSTPEAAMFSFAVENDTTIAAALEYNEKALVAGGYNEDVTIKATGYTISDTVDGTYAESYTAKISELPAAEGIWKKTLYFKKDSEEIKAMSISIKYDTLKPEATATAPQGVDLGIDWADVTFASNEDGSSIYYIVADKAAMEAKDTYYEDGVLKADDAAAITALLSGTEVSFGAAGTSKERLSSITAGTEYILLYVGEDAIGNTSSIKAISFTTKAASSALSLEDSQFLYVYGTYGDKATDLTIQANKTKVMAGGTDISQGGTVGRWEVVEPTGEKIYDPIDETVTLRYIPADTDTYSVIETGANSVTLSIAKFAVTEAMITVDEDVLTQKQTETPLVALTAVEPLLAGLPKDDADADVYEWVVEYKLSTEEDSSYATDVPTPSLEEGETSLTYDVRISWKYKENKASADLTKLDFAAIAGYENNGGSAANYITKQIVFTVDDESGDEGGNEGGSETPGTPNTPSETPNTPSDTPAAGGTTTPAAGSTTTPAAGSQESAEPATTTTTTTTTGEDGSTTEKVTEVAADGTVVKTTTTVTAADGSAVITEKEKETNSAGKTVSVTTKTEVNADGEVTAVTEKSTITAPAANTTATVTVVKDGDDKVTSATASVKKTVADDSTKVTISGSVVSQIKEAAGRNVDVTMTVKDSEGKTKCKVTVNTKNMKAGNELYMYGYDSKTGEYTMVNAKTYTVSAKGGVTVSTKESGTYTLVTGKKAESIDKKILSTVKVKKSTASVKTGKTTKVAMSSKLNMDNVKKITYTSSKKSVATVSKNGKVTAKKAGTVTVKAKVTLKNGKTKTVKMTITVK